MCWHGSRDSCTHGCFEGHFGKCYIRSSRWSKLATSRSFHVKEEVWWHLFRNSVPSTNPSFISLVSCVMPSNLPQFKHIVLSIFHLTYWMDYAENAVVLDLELVVIACSCTEQIHKGTWGYKETSQGSSSRDKDLQAETGKSSNSERCGLYSYFLFSKLRIILTILFFLAILYFNNLEHKL